MKKVTVSLLFCALLAVPALIAVSIAPTGCVGRGSEGVSSNEGASGTDASANGLTTNEMNAQTITLTTPAESGATLLQALQARSSVREYASGGLTLEQLSGVLWAAAGVNRPGVDGAPGKLTAPSAMALYPIRTYGVLSNGIYLYDAPTHSLTRVAEGDFRRLAGLQDFVYTAPLNIMYIADISGFGDKWSSGASKPEDADGGMPEHEILRVCALDAAGYCQNANLWAAGNGLGAVTRAGAHGEEFLKAINAPASYRFVLAQTVGVAVK